jgi:hypothetical protein
MNALLASKAKSKLSLFLICRILCTDVTADDGSGHDGGDLGRALERGHGIGCGEFD